MFAFLQVIQYPSSGWMGMFLMSRVCSRISAFGFSASFHKDYREIGHDYLHEHEVLKKWHQYKNPSVPLVLFPPLPTWQSRASKNR